MSFSFALKNVVSLLTIAIELYKLQQIPTHHMVRVNRLIARIQNIADHYPFIHDAEERFSCLLSRTQCHAVDIFVWERQEIGQGVNGRRFAWIFCWWCKNEWHFILSFSRNNGIKGATEKNYTSRSQTQQTLHHFWNASGVAAPSECKSLHLFSQFECGVNVLVIRRRCIS